MSLSQTEAAREARSEVARHAINTRWAKVTDPEERRRQTRKALLAGAVTKIVNAAPELSPEQVAKLRAILTPEALATRAPASGEGS